MKSMISSGARSLSLISGIVRQGSCFGGAGNIWTGYPRTAANNVQRPPIPFLRAWQSQGTVSIPVRQNCNQDVYLSKAPQRGISAFRPVGLRAITTTSVSLNAAAAAAAGEITGIGQASQDSLSKEITHKAQHHSFNRAHSKAWSLKTSVKKLNLVCKLVRRAHVDAALMQLSLTPKRSAKYVRKLIHEAKFNAAAMGMNPEKLIVDEIRIGRASYLKRVEYKGRGKTGIRRKPYCNIFVYVRETQPSDEFKFFHVKRKRPRWKCGRLMK